MATKKTTKSEVAKMDSTQTLVDKLSQVKTHRRNLSDYMQKKVNLSAIEGIPVTVESATFRVGTMGPYCVMSVTLPDGDSVTVVTGAGVVMELIEKAREDLPLDATFIKAGTGSRQYWTVEGATNGEEEIAQGEEEATPASEEVIEGKSTVVNTDPADNIPF